MDQELKEYFDGKFDHLDAGADGFVNRFSDRLDKFEQAIIKAMDETKTNILRAFERASQP
jgi:hypothetical protein